ncbi:MAG TPA: glycosyltransferase family 2 protein [Dehalococcoidia bacterium]|jgi:glycosyltransferase involved in cell wall biosynthesis|nr:glycosyltransferase family 2 protein [Dehalococcoidia bacterium]
MLSSVSAFFPCYNDSNTIRGLVLKVASVLPEITSDFEIIVVDDGSSDNSLQVLEEVSHEVPSLRIVRHTENRGYGSALTSGFASATRDFVFYTDGDGQYDPSEILVLATQMTPGVDVVNGYKRARQDPWYRSVAGGAYQQMARFLFSLPIRDVDCDFRLVRREVMRDIELQSRDGAICVELVRKLRDSGAKMIELPVSHYPRAFGTSQFFKPVRIVRALAGVGRWYVRLVLLREQKRRVAALAKSRVRPIAEPAGTKAPD